MQAANESDEDIMAQQVLIKEAPSGYFLATDADVLRFYAAHDNLKWVATQLDVKLWKTYTSSRRLDWLIEGLVRIGNANATTDLLKELKGRRLAVRQLAFHSFQLFMRQRHTQAGATSQQPHSNIAASMGLNMGQLPVQPLHMDAAAVCLFSPGYKFVRTMWLWSQKQRHKYQLRWREEQVKATTVHMDHCFKLSLHMMILSVPLGMYRLTQWNEFGQVPFAHSLV